QCLASGRPPGRFFSSCSVRAKPTGNSPMRRFEYRDGKSAKFWSIELQGASFRFTFGKIGSTGQTRLREFADPATAQREHDRAIPEKLREGYVEVGAAAPGPPAKPVVKPPPPPRPKPLKLVDRLHALFAEPIDDATLLAQLEALRDDSKFRDLLHVWGPA